MRLRESAGNGLSDRPSRDLSRHVVDRALWERQLLIRLQRVAGHLTFGEIGTMTGVHPETVRRYMTHGRPTAFFIAAIAKALRTPLEWLLHGQASDEPFRDGTLQQSGTDRAENELSTGSGNGVLEVHTPRRRVKSGGGRTVKSIRSR